jgi:hypothetical protein
MSKPKKPLRGLFTSTEARAPVAESKKDVMRSPTPVVVVEAQDVSPVTPVDSAAANVETPVMAPAAASIPTPPVIHPSIPAQESRVMDIHYNFDQMRPARESWQEHDYAHFLRQINAVQTEAFFLRGKLLSEVKNRFFETNKVGWAQYCESTLDMNYTTANQYIRVATEFDVTSHHRPDFGFEHFKALLPLPLEERSAFLNSRDTVSVKSIRSQVKQYFSKQETRQSGQTSGSPHRHSLRLIKMLEAVKAEVAMHGGSFENLTQAQRWQVSAACQNIAAHLNHLAESLNSDLRFVSSPRAGAFATVDGAAMMPDLMSKQESSSPSD